MVSELRTSVYPALLDAKTWLFVDISGHMDSIISLMKTKVRYVTVEEHVVSCSQYAILFHLQNKNYATCSDTKMAQRYTEERGQDPYRSAGCLQVDDTVMSETKSCILKTAPSPITTS